MERIPCKYCGREIPPGANFCWYCNRQLISQAERPEAERRGMFSWKQMLIWVLVFALVLAFLFLFVFRA